MVLREFDNINDYTVLLIKNEEGYAVSCPALKGCHSQGETREQALHNIKDAIMEWLEVDQTLA